MEDYAEVLMIIMEANLNTLPFLVNKQLSLENFEGENKKLV
jgi:hypothetical protein